MSPPSRSPKPRSHPRNHPRPGPRDVRRIGRGIARCAGRQARRWAALAWGGMRRLLPRWGFRPLAGVLVALLMAHALGLLPAAPLDSLEHLLHDAQLQRLAPQAPDARIVMVDIDERALAQHGRWPWPRRELARLLDAVVSTGGARLVALDIVLAEAERPRVPPADRPAPAQAGALPGALTGALSGALSDTPTGTPSDAGTGPPPAAIVPAAAGLSADDDALADALQRLPVVLALHFSTHAQARSGVLPPSVLAPAVQRRLAGQLQDWPGYGGVLPELLPHARHGFGHLNAVVDDDGVLRRMPLLLQHRDNAQPTLALAMMRQLLGSADAPARLQALPALGPLRQLQLVGAGGQRAWPTDAHADVVVPYRHHPQAFVRLSAADVLAGRLPADALRGKLVLVGVSAPGLIDQRATPVDSVMPGTLVHAHLLSGLLDGRVLATPHEAPALQALALLLCGVGLAALLPRVGLLSGVGLVLLSLLLLLAGHAALWHWARLALPMGDALLLPPLLLGLHLLTALQAATGARRRLAALFGQYVPPELVAEMSRHPERHTMTSRSAELSILFADVRGFTGLAERMPPAELSAMMNLIFSRLTDIIRSHRGTLDKYIGDAVMAFWGAPLDDAEHARHAVDAALAMRAALPDLQRELARRGWPQLDLSIGVDSGTVVVGDMGSRHRLAYTVMGDAVNRAARIQGLAAAHGLGLVIGDTTQRALDGARLCLPLGPVQLRGRDAPLHIWQPLPTAPGSDPAVDRRASRMALLQVALDEGLALPARALLAELQAEAPAEAPLWRWLARRLDATPPPAPLLTRVDAR